MARSRVSGSSRVPAPPARIIASVLLMRQRAFRRDGTPCRGRTRRPAGYPWRRVTGLPRVRRRHGRLTSGPAPAGLSRRSLIKRGLSSVAPCSPRGARGSSRCAAGRTVRAARSTGLLVFTPGAVLGARRGVTPDGPARVRAGPPWMQVRVARAADRIAARVDPSAAEGAAAAARPVRERARRASSSAGASGRSPGWTAPSRTAVLCEWQDSRLRSGAPATPRSRRWCSPATTGRPKIWPAVGYRGPPDGSSMTPTRRSGKAAASPARTGPACGTGSRCHERRRAHLHRRRADALDTELHCDVCMVGSGAGGAVLANELCRAGAGRGAARGGRLLHAPGASTARGPRLSPTSTRSMGNRATDDRRCIILQGRSVGGGTTVNWCTSLPHPAAHARALARPATGCKGLTRGGAPPALGSHREAAAHRRVAAGADERATTRCSGTGCGKLGLPARADPPQRAPLRQPRLLRPGLPAWTPSSRCW